MDSWTWGMVFMVGICLVVFGVLMSGGSKYRRPVYRKVVECVRTPHTQVYLLECGHTAEFMVVERAVISCPGCTWERNYRAGSNEGVVPPKDAA